jgi:hypothetical protein
VSFVLVCHFCVWFGHLMSYASRMVHSCNISFSAFLYHCLHLYHMLWRMCFSHIHCSLWYVGDEPMIMLDVLLKCIAMLSVAWDMYACEMAIFL